MNPKVLIPVYMDQDKLTITFCLSNLGLCELVVEVKEDKNKHTDFVKTTISDLAKDRILCSDIAYFSELLLNNKRFNYTLVFMQLQSSDIADGISLAACRAIHKLKGLDVDGYSILESSINHALMGAKM